MYVGTYAAQHDCIFVTLLLVVDLLLPLLLIGLFLVFLICLTFFSRYSFLIVTW